MGIGLGVGSEVMLGFRGARVRVGLGVRLQLWIHEKKVHNHSENSPLLTTFQNQTLRSAIPE